MYDRIPEKSGYPALFLFFGPGSLDCGTAAYALLRRLVCLPNYLIVEITGSREGGDADDAVDVIVK